jgi:hypothetical protein
MNELRRFPPIAAARPLSSGSILSTADGRVDDDTEFAPDILTMIIAT